jgi:hypothetical protein
VGRLSSDEEKKMMESIANIIYELEPGAIFQDRRRPYNGQPHTDQGERGKTEVKGLTMRDIADCFRVALWETCGSPDDSESIYHLDLSDISPVAVEQNLTCNIEKMMGIYPNVPELTIGDSGKTWEEYYGEDGADNP